MEKNKLFFYIQDIAFNYFNKFVVINEKEVNNRNFYSDFINKPYLLNLNKLKYFTDCEIQVLTSILDNNIVLPQDVQKTFYETFNEVRKKDRLELFFDQVLHYFTTYGMETITGEVIPELVYIPNKNINNEEVMPEVLLKNIKFIDFMSLEEFKENILKLVQMNIALNSNSVEKIFYILENLDMLKVFEKNAELLKNIKNKELKTLISTKIIPEDPELFLRQIVYILTGKTLFIKNFELISSIVNSLTKKENIFKLHELLIKYKEKYGLKNLARIFNRNKEIIIPLKNINLDYFAMTLGINDKYSSYFDSPYYDFYEEEFEEIFKMSNKKSLSKKDKEFLEIEKKAKEIRKIINKISKLSKKYHVPYKTPDYLKITSGKFTLEEIINIVNKMDTSYLVKLLKAVRIRLNMIEKNISIYIYFIRNGKIYYKKENDFNKLKELKTYYLSLENIIKEKITEKINKKIQEEKIVIKGLEEQKIRIAVPFNDKKMIGNIPFGSYIKLEDNKEFVVGIYWENKLYNIKNNKVREERIDLDLSLTNSTEKFGWNGSYYDNNVIFSGDMTDARNGATEMFYIKEIKENDIYLLNVNFFNSDDSEEDEIVKYKFFISKTENLKNDSEIVNKREVKNKIIKTFKKESAKNEILNDIYFQKELEISKEQSTNGVLLNDKFIFANIVIPYTNVSKENTEEFIMALKNYIETYLYFDELEIKSYEKQKEDEEVKELDFNNINKSLLLTLIS